jgi:hypothetical protein
MGINIEEAISTTMKKFNELLEEYELDKEWAIWIRKIIMKL